MDVIKRINEVRGIDTGKKERRKEGKKERRKGYGVLPFIFEVNGA